MKKTLSIILVFVLVLGLTACGKNNENLPASSAVANSEESSSQAQTSSEEHEIVSTNTSSQGKKPEQSSSNKVSSVSSASSASSQQNTQSDKPVETSSEIEIPKAPDYKTISCRSVGQENWKSVIIKNSKKGIAIDFKIPSDWTITAKDDSTYTILRAGKAIGTLSTKAPNRSQEYFADTSYIDIEKMIQKFYQIDWYYTNGQGSFYKSFDFLECPQTVGFNLYLQVNHNELDDAAAKHLFDSAGTSSTIGNLPIPPLPQNSSSKEILILGNSFIGSSQIALILNEMLAKANSEYTVKTVSIGGAYTGTFFEDKALMNDIKSGKYCYVFQCGLYSSLAVATFAPLKEVYDEAGVPVVFFPAHNESEASINSALQQYYDVPILSWKGELDALIKSGISRDTFCQNDYYGHSKPIAGYVGAHMIFRTLFGKMPTDDTISVKKDEVRTVLGSYVDTGVVPGTTPKETFVGTEYSIK